MIFSKNPPQLTEVLKQKHVGIAGLGGLGSNVAVMMTRAGIGKLTLVDFDKVDASNMNRQHYFQNHLGSYKTEALSEQLLAINPELSINAVTVKVSSGNVHDLFGEVDLLVEAFDLPENKSMLVDAWHNRLRHIPLVGASGMAGSGGFDDIGYKKLGTNLHLVGDFVTEASEATGLISPRVTLVCAMQALLGIRLLLGKDDSSGKK